MLAFPPDGTCRIGGEGPRNCTVTPEGMLEVERLTFPANPFRLRAITPKLRVEFWAVTIGLGEVNRLKSPGELVVIKRDPDAVWDRVPLVAVAV